MAVRKVVSYSGYFQSVRLCYVPTKFLNYQPHAGVSDGSGRDVALVVLTPFFRS